MCNSRKKLRRETGIPNLLENVTMNVVMLSHGGTYQFQVLHGHLLEDTIQAVQDVFSCEM